MTLKEKVTGDNKHVLFVLSGPSGVGKDVVLMRIRKLARSMRFVVTTTTRAKREIESNGVHYDFVSRDKFEDMIEKKKLLEWAEVYGNYYGVPRDRVERAFKEGHDVMVKVDVQGAMTIKKVMPHAVLIFLAPPSMEELEDRLRKRNTESSADLSRRITTAQEEMALAETFNYIVVNNVIEDAVDEIMDIIAAEKRLAKTGKVKL
ncbi:MAG: guanylate kinase [Dehalococcoidia bacterium]